ncbi:MAG TPA: sulfate permease, partial [Hyphomonas sp.]|nr:sulfate permease [Hyphomonas sp.]
MKPKILTTIQTYSGPLFVADLFAGVTVALVAIPLSLAIAIASGADPAAGLVTAIIAGFLISFLGGSRVQIGGPTGAFIVVVFGVIVAHGYDGLVLATFMAGIILIVAGLMRAGNLISFVPEAVVNGFTIGIAIIIAASQLNDLFGLTTSGLPAEFFSKLEVLWAARGTVNWASVGIGAVTMVLIVGLRRVAPKFPGLIVAVGLTSAVVYLFHLPVDTIGSRFGALPSQLPMPKLP